ncbi:histidine decarboxylase [Nocardia sp. NPDC057668]|uniref:histidine decarboxylase n=1 Tax=Nocardia sp. NPDC057668 TaxID=3346202 RepID=UPI003670C3CF
MTVSAIDRYRIGRNPQPPVLVAEQLDSFIAGMRTESPYVLGFPGNLDFSYSRFGGLLDILTNNVGDPGSDEKSGISSKAMERAVVEATAELANAQAEATFGYVASGGSEANQFGLDRGCTYLPDARVFCSSATHYSVVKNVRLMRRELAILPADQLGRMDVAALERECRKDRGRGAVVVANAGTTMTGAIDDVAAVVEAAGSAGRVYVHLDAALSGLILPFTEQASSWGFAHPAVGSLGMSMHKLLGMPVPCAVALCRTEFVQAPPVSEYIGITDSTLSCSRSGLAASLIWYAMAVRGAIGLERTAHSALKRAQYISDRLVDLGLRTLVNPNSIIVVFDRPAEWICRKYHLATEADVAHIVALPHITSEVIDELCDDLAKSRARLRGTGADPYRVDHHTAV